MSELPAGMAVGKAGIEAARLTLQLNILCREHRVNTVHDLPPEPFQEAMALQARLDALKRQQQEALAERGRRGLAKAHNGSSLRKAARLDQFRKTVAARGGLAAVNKVRLGRDLGLSRTTVQSYVKVLEAEAAAGPPRCPACGQLVHIEAMPTIHDTNDDREGQENR